MANFAIFGCTGGIGLSITQKLLNQGHRIFGVARNLEKLDDLKSKNQNIITHSIENPNFDEIEDSFKMADNYFENFSGIINCIGSLVLKPAHITNQTDWDNIILTNLTSSMSILRSSVKRISKEGGSIIFFSSSAGLIGLPNHEAIASAKAGIIGLTKSAAATYAKKNIRVNCIAPGLVNTPLSNRIINNKIALETSLKLHPLNKIGEPDVIAECIEWLISEKNNWTTGQVISLDGGLTSVK
tara:strand:- start:567 stop:1292 length:726 start_codon:yes stop_codon:yes gene_type:complete